MSDNTSFRRIGFFNRSPIYLRTYPTHVELTISGKVYTFMNYDSAMQYFQKLTSKNRIKELQRYDYSGKQR